MEPMEECEYCKKKVNLNDPVCIQKDNGYWEIKCLDCQKEGA